MEWLKALTGAVVGLDTAPLIYFIEENRAYIPVVQPFFDAVDRGAFRVVTSVLTLTEVLIHPMRKGEPELADRYRRILLEAEHVSTIPVSEIIAEEAAQLRARHGLRTPDAIQLATALRSQAAFFITNDSRLPELAPLKVLVLNQLRSSLQL